MEFCIFILYLPNSLIALVSYSFFQLILLIFLYRESLMTNKDNFVSSFFSTLFQVCIIQEDKWLQITGNLPDKGLSGQDCFFSSLRSLEGSSLWPLQCAQRGHGGPQSRFLFLHPSLCLWSSRHKMAPVPPSITSVFQAGRKRKV